MSCALGVAALANSWPGWLAAAVGVLVLFTLGHFAIRYAQWASTHFVLTTERLVFRKGLVAKSGVEIPLDKVNTVFFEQSVWGRIFGFGTIKIESASEQGAQVFSDVRKPQLAQNLIYQQIEANQAKDIRAMGEAVGAATGRSEPSIPDQIEKLGELRDKGIITEEEFQRKKAELLERM